MCLPSSINTQEEVGMVISIASLSLSLSLSVLMAIAKVPYVCVFLLLLILSHLVLSSEGRHLKAEKRTECEKCVMSGKRSASHAGKKGFMSQNMGRYEVKGKLGTPGPSAPGKGHALKNKMH